MPRRPNTKNLPSRLHEESQTPCYIVDAKHQIVYANAALADLFDLSRDELIGLRLKYDCNQSRNLDQGYCFALCPPPRIWPHDTKLEESTEKDAASEFRFQLSQKEAFVVQCNRLDFEDDGPVLVCYLYLRDRPLTSRETGDWLHEKIQAFRRVQSNRFHAIPYLGESPAARKCFAQASSYALIESNVLVVGNPQSQVVDLAKAIHYSGFSDNENPNPLLPINCRQVEGERIQEILVGHCQVNAKGRDDSQAFILLMNAEALNALAQRDLLEISALPGIKLRFVSTAARPLTEIEEFDSELAHRLSTLELQIPDLVERQSDVPFLAQSLLESHSGKTVTLTKEFTDSLQVYPWKGDYEELKQIVEYSLQSCKGHEVKLTDSPHHFQMALRALEEPMPRLESIKLDQLLKEVEKKAIQRAINLSRGNKTNAARILGITRARLHRKIAEFLEESE